MDVMDSLYSYFPFPYPFYENYNRVTLYEGKYHQLTRMLAVVSMYLLAYLPSSTILV